MNQAAYKVFTNIEISANIFQYLNFKEQLKLTKMNEQFKYIIQNSIWKLNWKTLQIFEADTNIIQISNKDCVNRSNINNKPMYSCGYSNYFIKNLPEYRIQYQAVHLTKDELSELLRTISKNVEKLEIGKASTNECETSIIDVILREEYSQLTELKLFCLNISANNMQIIASKCPKLKTLIFEKCEISDFWANLIKINMLKELIVIKSRLPSDRFTITELLNKLPMLQYFTDAPIVGSYLDYEPSSNMTTASNTKSHPLQILNIRNGLYSSSNLDFSKTVFNNCQNIQELSISGYNQPLQLSVNFFDILKTSCKNLINLNLTFCNVTHFKPLPQLKILALNTCDNITWLNFKQILNEMKLNSFTASVNRYYGTFECFEISSTLQFLHIETMEIEFQEEIKKLLEYNKENVLNLKTLVWHNSLYWYDGEYTIVQLPLQCQYKNLQTLTIDLDAVSCDDIFRMNELTELSLISHLDRIEFSQILSLLKHPTLKHLTLYQIEKIESNIKHLSNTDTLICETNLLYLNIPLEIFKELKNICLGLLTRNTKLQLCCYYYSENMVNCEFLNQLLNDDKFPKRIKTFSICGFTIDCESFKINMDYAKNVIIAASKYSELRKESMYLTL